MALLYKIAYVGTQALPMDTRDYTSTLFPKVCALSQSILNISGGTIFANGIHFFYMANAIICGIPYSITVA